MKTQFCTLEIALALKELGFNEVCLGIYNREKVFRFNNCYNPVDRTKSGFPLKNNGQIPAPLWQQVIDWLREKYNIHIWIYYDLISEYQFYQIRHEISKGEYHHYTNELTDVNKFSYKLSREQAILKAIEIIKIKNHE